MDLNVDLNRARTNRIATAAKITRCRIQSATVVTYPIPAILTYRRTSRDLSHGEKDTLLIKLELPRLTDLRIFSADKELSLEKSN
jgi:hypothetical protein